MILKKFGLNGKRAALKGQPETQEYFLVKAGDVPDKESGYEFLTGWFYAHPKGKAPGTGWFRCDETDLYIKIGKGVSSGSWKVEEEVAEEAI